MRNIVIDTNVFAAALQSKLAASYRLLSLIGQDKFEVYISVPLILEYEEIGRRLLANTSLSENDLSATIDYICQICKPTQVFYLWRPFLNDSDDDMILELAVAGSCDTIITFNVKDFAKVEDVFGIRILLPKQFLVEIGELK
ncbi:MAG: putative toxin-antitoxin system toxin component, PIN family [Anaerolineaceae bacterium]|nr:putative toxin-antitoxin system toxin component, PIN family [Anaerolineaceae bacterium]